MPVPLKTTDKAFDSLTFASLAKTGDREAFGKLVHYYQDRLYGLAYMILGNHWAADEIVQDSFIRAFKNLDLFDESRPFYPWLSTITVRLSQNWLKRQALITAREQPIESNHRELQSSDTPLQGLLRQKEADQLWKSVADLPQGERSAIFLFYRQQMKVEDIAQALGVSSGTVKTMLFRARKKLAANKKLQEINHPHPSTEANP